MDALRYKLLLVDDEPDMLTTYQALLEGEGFTVLCARSVPEALAAARESAPDIVLSDVAMPDRDGKALAAALRADPATAAIPVVLMSGTYKEEDDQAGGLEAGADDYLPKPASPRLLAARLRAVLGRSRAPAELASVLKAEGLRLDPAARIVTRGGKRVPLTRKEFDLLTTFLRRPGRVLNVPYLLETVWGYDPAVYNNPRTVTVHVSSLRTKLGKAFAARLVSVPGLGYRFETGAI
ncbi:MAG: response regulator transcription factor [Elusimicrobia bacterium]|nr:response regulator transcription factor [Elusimicrobiota bacterium]